MDTVDNIKNRLKELDKEKEQLSRKLKELEYKLDPPEVSYNPQHNNVSLIQDSIDLKSSPDQKIKIFRSLFRGRDDVYACFWISKKTGKKGYSPACKNEWIQGICKKPVIKCTNCPNRELSPLNNDVLYAHLSGKQVIGMYPMLPDESCYFLAIDFDGKGWTDDSAAFRQTCHQEGVPVYIERSRSGDGAHAWIFFQESIPAATARQMGSFLVTQTMSKHYQLDMKSYDRLFPNQDTMPQAGFGNLIALPLQKEAGAQKNTLFIDENNNPYPDQWLFLSGVSGMTRSAVERIAKHAVKTGRVVGVRMETTDEQELPWMRLPSGKTKYRPVIKDLPDIIEIVLANRIYIKTNSLPSVFLNQIKRLAAFQNPEFYKKQNMRKSTALIPRVISCADIIDGYLALPRGCLEDISALFDEYGVEIKIKNEQTIGKKVNFKFCGSLSFEQKIAAAEMLKHNIGILVAPPASGKTVIATHVISKRKRSTLILVHRKLLMEQWRMRLASFLNIDLKNIGQIGGGKDKANGVLDVGMIQSLQTKGVVDDRIASYGFVISDECHHISPVSFERVILEVKAKYVMGLTATPYRRDGHQPIIWMQCGPIRYKASQKDMKKHILHYIVIAKETGFKYEWTENSNIYDLWPDLINNEKRNTLIINDIIETIEEQRFPLILTERRAHLDLLADKLKDKINHLVILHGGITPKKRKQILEELEHCPADESKAILATGTYIGEGFDDPRLDTLFITMPISFKGKVVQYAGRLHRKYSGKQDVRIYDYIDKDVSVLWKMYQRRLKTYNSMGYDVRTEQHVLYL
ncbi:MAG: DEAD/DEAH box helicase [Candidatus Omnitrophica bacterium]|nr:DEAD/DEAH box helicase [Candidatus Omnitrophota bacterium]